MITMLAALWSRFGGLAIEVLIVCALVGGLVGGGYYWGHQGKVELLAQLEVERKIERVRVEKVVEYQDRIQTVVQEKIKTVYRDRTITKEVPIVHEVEVRMDAACPIPQRFVSVWNSANELRVPTPAELIDETPSGVVLSDIEAQHDKETEGCHVAIGQVRGWNSFYDDLRSSNKH